MRKLRLRSLCDLPKVRVKPPGGTETSMKLTQKYPDSQAHPSLLVIPGSLGSREYLSPSYHASLLWFQFVWLVSFGVTIGFFHGPNCDRGFIR